MSRRKHIPLAWDDDDDWSSPAAPASAPAAAPPPRTLYEPEHTNSQPRTLYQPELKILKRSTPSSPSASAAASSASQSPRLSPASARRERERRYQEAKDRIFNNTSNSTPSASANNTPPNASPTPTPPPKPKRKSPASPPPGDTGTIMSISLNSATITAAPVARREKEEWKIRQVAIDGKMLESQAQQYQEEDAGTEGAEDGLEWDEFRRDVLWRPDEGARVFEGETDLVGKVEALRVEEEAAVRSQSSSPPKAVRAPQGPDVNGGKGFRGRGAGRRGGVSRGG